MLLDQQLRSPREIHSSKGRKQYTLHLVIYDKLFNELTYTYADTHSLQCICCCFDLNPSSLITGAWWRNCHCPIFVVGPCVSVLAHFDFGTCSCQLDELGLPRMLWALLDAGFICGHKHLTRIIRCLAASFLTVDFRPTLFPMFLWS